MWAAGWARAALPTALELCASTCKAGHESSAAETWELSAAARPPPPAGPTVEFSQLHPTPLPTTYARAAFTSFSSKMSLCALGSPGGF